jgi:DNA-binding transcriptional LysR family regulator
MVDRKIRAFLAIVEEGTLTGAAGRIGLAQPSLTKFLKRLELELGAKLFERRTRGMELTAFGESFLGHARRIEAEYKFAVEEISAMRRGGLPVLRIGAGPLYHMLHLPMALQVLVREFPGTRLDVIADINRTVMPMLQRGEIDIVCGEIEPEVDGYGMEKVELLPAEIGIVMRPSHPLAGQALSGSALAGWTWVVFQQDDRALARLSKFMGGDRLGFRVAVSTSSFATACGWSRDRTTSWSRRHS